LAELALYYLLLLSSGRIGGKGLPKTQKRIGIMENQIKEYLKMLRIVLVCIVIYSQDKFPPLNKPSFMYKYSPNLCK